MAKIVGHLKNKLRICQYTSPKYILNIYGSCGSGKTEIIKWAADKLNFKYVWVDELVGVVSTHKTMLHLTVDGTKSITVPFQDGVVCVESIKRINIKSKTKTVIYIDFDSDAPTTEHIGYLRTLVYNACKEQIDSSDKEQVVKFNEVLKQIKMIDRWPSDVRFFIQSYIEYMWCGTWMIKDEIDDFTYSMDRCKLLFEKPKMIESSDYVFFIYQHPPLHRRINSNKFSRGEEYLSILDQFIDTRIIDEFIKLYWKILLINGDRCDTIRPISISFKPKYKDIYTYIHFNKGDLTYIMNRLDMNARDFVNLVKKLSSTLNK